MEFKISGGTREKERYIESLNNGEREREKGIRDDDTSVHC